VIRCALVCDGTSDRSLAGVVERLGLSFGVVLDVQPVDFSILQPGLDLVSRMRVLPQLVASPAIVLVHRDAERSSRHERASEISDALFAAALDLPHVAIVPVRMTEAWLLCDDGAIRSVAGNPSGGVTLNLPGKRAEKIPDPKRVLRELLLEASGQRGRRRRAQVDGRFPELRRQLLETLDVTGGVASLPSFVAFAADLRSRLASLKA
jgi:hypothetical protein